MFLSVPLAINGYVYGNLPPPKVCVGRPVSWHLFGIGNEVDIHSAYFHGHTLLDRGHRTDVLSLFPATFVTATMIPRTKGKWLLNCQVNDHVRGSNGCVSHLCVDTSVSDRCIKSFFVVVYKTQAPYVDLGFNVHLSWHLSSASLFSFVFI